MAKEESYIAQSMVVWRRPQQYVQVPAYPFKRPKSPDFSFGISMFNSRTRQKICTISSNHAQDWDKLGKFEHKKCFIAKLSQAPAGWLSLIFS